MSTERVIAAAKRFLDKVNECQPYIDSATTIAAIHGCPYPREPNYGQERDELTAALEEQSQAQGRGGV